MVVLYRRFEMSGTCSMDRRTVPVRGTIHLRKLGKAEDRSSLREKVTNAGTGVNLLRWGLVVTSCDDLL